MWGSSNSAMASSNSKYTIMNMTNDPTIFDNSRESNFKRGGHLDFIPVMIAHLNRHGENLTIWGTPVRTVTFLGILLKIDEFSTKITFELRDETGTITGLKWLDSETDSYVSPVRINSYARIYGRMRRQDNKSYVLIHNIQPMLHMSELLVHLMEVTLVSLKGAKKAEEVSKQDQSLIKNSGTILMSDLDMISGLTREQALIVNIIQNGHPENGAERNEIKARVPSHMSSKVDEILDFLSGEGHIYTTVTDDHFKLIF